MVKIALFESNWISWFKKMSVVSLSYWESDVYWRQHNKHFAELAPQNGGKQLMWRNYVTVTLCIIKHWWTDIWQWWCEQVFSLQCEVDSYRQELEQFELIRSDWQTEKESLEAALMKLRWELKTRDEKLNTVHISKVIHCVSARFLSFVLVYAKSAL